MICWVDGAQEQLCQMRPQSFAAQPREGKLVEGGHFSVPGGNEVTDTGHIERQ